MIILSLCSQSQQDLTFPPTPTAKPKKEMNQRPVTVPKVTEGKPETKEDKNNNLSTLDELKEQLRKNYKEAQAARERFKSLKSPKTLEGITKNSPNVKARVGSPKESSTDFTDFSKTLSSIHQNWVQVLPTGPKESIGNGHTKQFSPDKFTWSKGQFTLTTQNSTPSENGHVITDSSPKKAFEFWSKTSPKKSDEETSLLLPLKLNHSPDSTTKLLDSSEASQTEDIDSDEDVISDLFSNKIESSSSGNSKPSKQGSGSSWKSLYSPEKDAKDFEKEISEDFSQFLSTYTTKVCHVFSNYS